MSYILQKSTISPDLPHVDERVSVLWEVGCINCFNSFAKCSAVNQTVYGRRHLLLVYLLLTKDHMLLTLSWFPGLPPPHVLAWEWGEVTYDWWIAETGASSPSNLHWWQTPPSWTQVLHSRLTPAAALLCKEREFQLFQWSVIYL